MRIYERSLLSLCLLSALAPACERGSGSAAPGELSVHVVEGPALLFDDVRVFDGERDLGVVDVVVEGDRITHVGVARVAEGASGVERIDGQGGALTLLPGLIDAHVHVASMLDLKRAIAFGITTELDQFMIEQTMGKIVSRQARGKLLDYADLRSAGTCATPPGGHGTEYGLEIDTIDAPEEIDAWMDARVEAGASWIKVIYDDGHAANISFAKFERETLAAVVEAAHARGLQAVVHVSDLEAARDALEVGADGLAHMFFDAEADPAFVELAVERELFVTDTLAVMHALCGDPRVVEIANDEHLLALSDPRRGFALQASLDAMAPRGFDCTIADANTAALHAAGVDILASTDVPNLGLDHGLAMHIELGLLVDAGLSPAQALRSATAVPARRFGLDDRGQIAAQLRADLLLVEGDPTADIAAARAIVGVWKAGARVDLDAHRELIAERREAMAARKQAAPPVGSESGWIADFEAEPAQDEAPLEARFGAGWQQATNQGAGAKSSVSLARIAGGAGDSAGALEIRGEVVQDGKSPAWAGAGFIPSEAFGQVANLSGFEGVRFEVAGTPGTYSFMVFVEHRGMMPVVQTFSVSEAWTTVELREIGLGAEGWDVLSMFIGATQPGSFELRVDDVRLIE